MFVACVAFTRTGLASAYNVVRSLEEHGERCELHAPSRLARKADTEGVLPYEDLDAWTRHAFGTADALLFVGASGIAVRAIAPYVLDKLTDPAVVCMDEKGRYCIPMLSGHVGGANELARRVAHICGGHAVITTATDVNDVFTVDEWATKHGFALLDRNAAKRVSATLLAGKTVGVSCDLVPSEAHAASQPARALNDLLASLPPGLVRDERGSHDVGICITYDSTHRPFAHTLRLVPRAITVGVGCRRNTPTEVVARLVDEALRTAHIDPRAVCTLATIDIKVDERCVQELVRTHSWELRLYSANELAAVSGDFSSSAFVLKTVGVDNVSERAACARGEHLVGTRIAKEGVTVALGSAGLIAHMGTEADHQHTSGTLYCVGLGPGGADDMTLRARSVLCKADLIVGYTTYVNLIKEDFPQAEYLCTPMHGEVDRCKAALQRTAQGSCVALVCSGDPGVYAMAGLVLELAEELPYLDVRVVPGVTAATGGAALLGAPLMHDWCCVSLSDLMTPWEHIEKRLDAAARTGLCVCLYNPASHKRTDHLQRACEVLMRHLPAHTVCGIAKNIGRDGQYSRVLTLGELAHAQADMTTCVYVGNEHTRVINGRMVTPRGYQLQGS